MDFAGMGIADVGACLLDLIRQQAELERQQSLAHAQSEHWGRQVVELREKIEIHRDKVNEAAKHYRERHKADAGA